MTLLRIDHLNHAAVLLHLGERRLLFDPWFEGTAFDDGWGLRWHNPAAYETAAAATHLWISHPHSDHLHRPTLARLAERNPRLRAYANQSYNYDLCGFLSAVGFTDVRAFPELAEESLGGGVIVSRIGSTAIESMLVIRWNGLTLLNLNDCALRPYTRRRLLRELGGRIDLLLCNFNHAGKLLHHPARDAERVKESLRQNFRDVVRDLAPRAVLPFASLHTYLQPYAAEQNASLLEPEDLRPLAPARTSPVILYPGQSAAIDFAADVPAVSVTGALPRLVSEEEREREPGAPIDEAGLRAAVGRFEARVAERFGPFRFLLPPLAVRVAETGEILRVERGRVRRDVRDREPDIETTREKLAVWFRVPFGTDTFVVGAHFAILRDCIARLKGMVALLILAESEIAPTRVLRPALWGFLWRRRAEAAGMLLSGRVASDWQS